MIKKIAFLILVIIAACTHQKQLEPVNPDASKEAKALLSFLYEIQGKYTLSGQHNFLIAPDKYNEMAKEITGKYPVVWGADFSFNVTGDNAKSFQHCGPVNLIDLTDSFYYHGIDPNKLRNEMVDKAIELYGKGHIITLMWHNCFPSEGDSCDGSSVWAMENRPTQEQWDSLITEGTALNNAWKKQVDIIIPYLEKLRDAKVPVLWRPYHEMNGIWFWWCNQKGENGYIKLWKMMFHYFTNEKKLNNLLWVWNSNAPRDKKGDEAFPYEQFYPGNNYVDVMAADVYANDYKQSHHDQLIEMGKGKLIALGEVGNMPNDSILNVQNNWSWFMTWGYFIKFRTNQPDAIKALYNSPKVLTLDEIVKHSNGEYSIAH